MGGRGGMWSMCMVFFRIERGLWINGLSTDKPLIDGNMVKLAEKLSIGGNTNCPSRGVLSTN